MLTQTDAFGHTLSWQYNSAGQMTQMTDPAGGIYQYSYDISGNLTGVIYPDLSSKTYWYNESVNTGGKSPRRSPALPMRMSCAMRRSNTTVWVRQ